MKKYLFEHKLMDADQALLRLSSDADERGFIFRLTGVLYTHGCNIVKARANTSLDGKIEDEFLLQIPAGSDADTLFSSMEEDLNHLLKAEISVYDYLKKFPAALEKLEVAREPSPETFVKLKLLPGEKQAEMTIHAPDRPGLLFSITQVMFHYNFDIIAIQADPDQSGYITDKFILADEHHGALDHESVFRLRSALLKEL